MSQNHIRSALSTIVVIFTFLMALFTLPKEKSFLKEEEKEYAHFQPQPKNISFDGSHYSNSPSHRVLSHTRVIVEENNTKMSTLQVGAIDKFRSFSSNSSEHLSPSLQRSLQLETHPSQLMNSSSIRLSNYSAISASENVNIPVTVPNDLKRLRPMILDDFPSKFLPSYKNPCYIKYTTDKKLHCLPYFFLLGTPKSGTTDIWSKILAHPEIVAAIKEPHWWTRTSYPSAPLEVYEKRYMTNAIVKRTGTDIQKKQLTITGDGSASTFWDNMRWKEIYPEYDQKGPPYIMADVIHTVLPNAKLLVSFRDPTYRLYSDYIFFKPVGVTSPENFHDRVVTEINKFSTCLTNRSLEACAYCCKDQKVRLNIGLYSVYLRDWLKRYPRHQLMALKLEEWHARCTQLLPEIFQFLEVSSLSPIKIADICKKPSQNITSKKKWIGPMLNSTREILRDFYRPFVVRLASILNDDRFLWDYNDRQELQTEG
ncbi:Carbohydrate sulfotransferase 15 [Holothuria leucospilota]|uniref:Carbohydrate sulfotransferase 15 n=1 Tax=Holothuria leucospilota TaxID=206669 RepID=A0A9Q1CIV2_HOLLE|nr:Carbohydrate sulfotransferase 15 [Holothuria leucospilota]